MAAKQTDNFWDRHLSTVVMVTILLAGQISGYSILTARVSALEERTKSMISSTEYQDLQRRVELLEKDTVPRSEHLLRDEQLNARLTNIETQQAQLQKSLDDAMTYLRSTKPIR